MAKIDVQPPYTNRGVESTSENGLRACVDWVQVTFKSVQNAQQIIDILGLDFDDFTEFENGKYGYSHHIRFGHIAIYYSYDQPHFHLEITGQGCREYEEFGKHDWVTLLGLITMLDVNISRFDIAIDDFKGYFTFPKLIKKIKQGHVRSRFREARIQEKVVLNDGSTAGTTIYFGSPKSDIQVRIYDKYQERLSKGKEVIQDIKEWNRTEIQLRDKRALQAVFELVENIYSVGPLVQGILRNYVLFIDPTGNDTNKRRWDISKFWLKFLNNVEPLKLSNIAPDMTIEKVKSWFEHSVIPNFALLMEAFDNNPELIKEWISKGKEKQKKKHENMLKRFNKEKQQSVVSIQDKKERIMKSFLPVGKVHKPVYKKNESSWDEDSSTREI